MIDTAFILVVAYSLLMVGIAFLSRYKGRNDERQYQEFSMASNDASWIAIAASLFSLIGGGEIIALSAFAFIYGYAGIFLFVGYALAFAFMGIMASRARISNEFVASGSFSLPDFMEERVGTSARIIFFLGSILAFFSVLILQFVTLGDLMAPISNIDPVVFTGITVATVATYMYIGGFRSVLRTDVVQAAIMLTIMTSLVLALSDSSSLAEAGAQTSTPTELMPIGVSISLVLAGFFGGVASADVWQRMLAARDDKQARIGFLAGATGLLAFGFLVVQIGLVGRMIEGINPDLVFSEVLTTALSPALIPPVVVLLLASIMSTVDTQSFLLSGLVEREVSAKLGREASTLRFRVLVVGVLLFAAAASFVAGSAVDVYTWLFSIFTVISPFAFAALFVRLQSREFLFVAATNASAFVALLWLGFVTLDNLYWLALSGVALYFAAYALSPRREHKLTEHGG